MSGTGGIVNGISMVTLSSNEAESAEWMNNADENGSDIDFFKDLQEQNDNKLRSLLGSREMIEQDIQQLRFVSEDLKKSIDLLEEANEVLNGNFYLEIDELDALLEENDAVVQDIDMGESCLELTDEILTTSGIELNEECIGLSKDLSCHPQEKSEEDQNELNNFKTTANNLDNEIMQLDTAIKNIVSQISNINKQMIDLKQMDHLLEED